MYVSLQASEQSQSGVGGWRRFEKGVLVGEKLCMKDGVCVYGSVAEWLSGCVRSIYWPPAYAWSKGLSI